MKKNIIHPEQLKGLSEREAEKKLRETGTNEIQEKKTWAVLKFLKWLVSPIALMLLAAAFLSLLASKIFDFYFILFLLLLNFFVGYFQEKKADNAIAKLQKRLSVKSKVLRDGVWKVIPARLLVPGDVIELTLGDIVPADVVLIEEKNVSVNESVLTGESLPKEKTVGEVCYSGSHLASGWGKASVQATGKNTYFGNILISVDSSYKRSLLEKDILSISKWLSLLSLAAVIILSTFFLLKKDSFLELLTLDLSLVIAGIPISLPTIMTLIISFGVLGLAKKKAVVRRLSALEDLANVNLLLSDKTGTLTKNEIAVEKVIAYGQTEPSEVVWSAFLTTRPNDKNSINQAIIKKKEELKLSLEFEVLDFLPFDSDRKRSLSRVKIGGEEELISAGAPQVIADLCLLEKDTRSRMEKDVASAAQEGYRSVAVAKKKTNIEEEKDMELMGLLLFSDTLEKDVVKTLEFIRENGIGIKMLTGDNQAIASRIAKNIQMEGELTTPQILGKKFSELSGEEFKKYGIFAEIMPADKSDLVKAARKNYVVAVTGDGVNDLPALKVADVGVAVKNAVDSLKSAADLTLFTSGISVIKNAILESRKIFARLYAYSVYRISESFRVIITIAILGIAYQTYPLSPIQLILLALLNDIPIISLAFNRVKVARKPSAINAKERLKLSTLFGTVGVLNSILFFILTKNFFHLGWETIQTLFFLKLTVSGHMLIYIAHTEERWYRYLPSRSVILATSITQIIGTILAGLGLFMSRVPFVWILFVWLWAFFWMQVSEIMKDLKKKIPSK